MPKNGSFVDREIIKHLGDLSDVRGDYQIKVNLISYNGRRPKIDIRRWNMSSGNAAQGIALSDEEAMDLKNILEIYFREKQNRHPYE